VVLEPRREGIHGWGTTFGTKDLKDYVVVDLGVYHNLLLLYQ
jgi:hypothetical protein